LDAPVAPHHADNIGNGPRGPKPRPLDHPQDHGGEKAERYDRRDGGQFGCEFHRKLSFPIGGVPVAGTGKVYRLPSASAKRVSLLHCTIVNVPQAEANNVLPWLWFMGFDN
jgi:hypothetical protein